jgi:hypothetical protein
MVNTNVFRGSDATLTLSDDGASTGESQIAKDTIDFYKLSPVGRASNVEVFVQTDLESFHEIGKRHPAVLRPGNINISGKIGRAFINGALLKLLLGKGAETARVAEQYPQPSFNLMLDLKDAAAPDTTSTLTIHSVKFENWAYSLPEDDFVMESVTFKGLFITVEDKEKSG